MTAIRNLVFACVFCLPSLAWSQVPQGGPMQGAGNSYVLFIHAGPKKPGDDSVKALAIRLLQRGYVVRQPEFDQDVVGGPGVDYFTDRAKDKAQDVANIVNEFLASSGAPPDPSKKLKPRLQNIKNPPTYLGVWLY